MTSTAIPRPSPAILNSPELKSYVETALPHTLAISMAGRVWALNARGETVAVLRPHSVAWQPPEAHPVMARPFDVCANLCLWDDNRPPWTDFGVLHGLEQLVTFTRTTGRPRKGRPRKSTIGTTVKTAEPLDARTPILVPNNS